MPKVLIADDDVELVELLTMRLKANNYDVVSAHDGLEAVQKVYSEHPDLIIMDIKMPHGGGETACEFIKMGQTFNKTPVIFITAYPEEKVVSRLFEMGASDFIIKPFTPEELLPKIHKMLEKGVISDGKKNSSS